MKETVSKTFIATSTLPSGLIVQMTDLFKFEKQLS